MRGVDTILLSPEIFSPGVIRWEDDSGLCAIGIVTGRVSVDGVTALCPELIAAGSMRVTGVLAGALIVLLCDTGALEKLGVGEGDGEGDGLGEETWLGAAGAGLGAGALVVEVECWARTAEERRRTTAKLRLESRIKHLLPAGPIKGRTKLGSLYSSKGYSRSTSRSVAIG